MIDLGNWLDEVYRFTRPIGADDIDDDPALMNRLMADARPHEPSE